MNLIRATVKFKTQRKLTAPLIQKATSETRHFQTVAQQHRI